MLYTLSLFATQPILFVEKYEWRSLSELEKCAIGTFWKSVGDALDISYSELPSGKTGFRDGLHWLAEIEAWSKEYEKRCMVPDIKNHETAEQTTAVLVYMLPKALVPVGLKFVSFMMDERLRRAMLYVLSISFPTFHAGILLTEADMTPHLLYMSVSSPPSFPFAALSSATSPRLVRTSSATPLSPLSLTKTTASLLRNGMLRRIM